MNRSLLASGPLLVMSVALIAGQQGPTSQPKGKVVHLTPDQLDRPGQIPRFELKFTTKQLKLALPPDRQVKELPETPGLLEFSPRDPRIPSETSYGGCPPGCTLTFTPIRPDDGPERLYIRCSCPSEDGGGPSGGRLDPPLLPSCAFTFSDGKFGCEGKCTGVAKCGFSWAHMDGGRFRLKCGCASGVGGACD